MILVLVSISLWYFYPEHNGYSNASSTTRNFPEFANAAAAEANLLHLQVQPPDYDQYANLKVPPLSPKKALETFKLEDGFRIELVAYEPDVVDPIAMDIDSDGRLWVVEMTSYMPVHDKKEEETSRLERVPESRIVILEDTTGDGRMDHSQIFMDKLVLPRAIKVLDDGVLIAEPPNVWFIQDTTGDGIGDTKELVYSHYGDPASDNVEHMDNGLMWGMDNWIYNAYCNVSFRRTDSGWETRPFEQLAQWGMTQDNWGRIYSSHNSRTLTTHLPPYGYSHRHPEFNLRKGINHNISESETMWPAHPTGVNRGYRVNEMVREDGTLKRSTATTGPVIYRGDQFGEEFLGNAFVPEPAGNLIKRLVGVNSAPGKIEATARFAYREKEFLTSTDERFRPVNMYNSPDGSLYVLDMYRGIFQHARYLTDYLRDYAVKHDLHKPVGRSRFGRIYRITREDHDIDYSTPKLSEKTPDELVDYLKHDNGWIRDTAQQLLVQRSPADVVSTIENLVLDKGFRFYTRLQALWTLEGYSKDHYEAENLFNVALSALDDPHPRIRAAAIRILEPKLRQGSRKVLNRLERMVKEEGQPYTRLQLLASLGESTIPKVLSILAEILNRNVENEYFREMALTCVYQQEEELLKILRNDYNWREGENKYKDWILNRLAEIADTAPNPQLQLTKIEKRLFELGKQKFQTCSACHGQNGQGIRGVAPSLIGSEWVTGTDPAALIRIVLDGFDKGDNNQNGNVAGVMPTHRFMTDEEVAAVLTYIRKSWENEASSVAPEKVADIRSITKDRNKEWTPKELKNLSN